MVPDSFAPTRPSTSAQLRGKLAPTTPIHKECPAAEAASALLALLGSPTARDLGERVSVRWSHLHSTDKDTGGEWVSIEDQESNRRQKARRLACCVPHSVRKAVET